MALGVWLLLFLVPIGVAHPIPDVPLRSFFEADGSVVIKIELDTRCFSQDPEAEPYLFLEDYLRLSEAERDGLRAQARAYADRVLQLSFEPGGAARPQWEFEFTTFRGRPSHPGRRSGDADRVLASRGHLGTGRLPGPLPARG